jgi:DNA-binding NarL/FixJ family response regulator
MFAGCAAADTGGMDNTPSPSHPAAAPALLRVFLVEDSPLIRERLDAMVITAGAAPVGFASSVGAAIDAILLSRPDLVILDMQLADGTGFDVLRALRAQAPEIDVYLLSNFAADPYRQLAERLGARGFFDKSREFGHMRDVVAQQVVARQAQQPLQI